MLDWWLENGPPVYISAASYLGLGKGSTTKDSGNLNELAAMVGPGGMIN